jgi:glutamine amidotransferase PdxT
MIPVIFVLSPWLVYLVFKLNHISEFPAIIKVQKISPVSKSMFEYRFHPELTAKSKILQICNKILEKYSLITALKNF